MKRVVSLVLCMVICFVLPACRTESDEAWEAAMGTPQPEAAPASMDMGGTEEAEDDELHGTLTISQFCSSPGDAVSALAMEFSTLHPGVKFNFEWFMSAWDLVGVTDAQYEAFLDNYHSSMRIKLVSGEAADILVDADRLKLYGVAHSGVFQDLLPYWERDMDPADYLTQVTDLGVIDGKMVMVPLAFRTNVAYVNKRVSDGLGLDLSQRNTIRVDEMIDWYLQAREQGLLPQDAPLYFNQGEDMKSQLFNWEKSSYLDWETHLGSFNSPAYMSFLQNLKAIPSGIVDQDERYLMTATPAVINELIRCRATGAETQVTNDPNGWDFAMQLDYVQETKEALFDVARLNDITMRDVAENPCDYLEGPFLIVDSSGQAAIQFRDELAVTSGCSNPELAWEFIKFCVSNRESTALLNGYPYINGNGIAVNRQIGRLMAQETRLRWAGQQEFDNLQWYWPGDVGPNVVESALDRLLSEPLINAKLYNMEDVNGYLDEFLVHELTTAEQCAKKLQDQAFIWLNE